MYFPGLYFFALRQLEDEDRAFDVTQETFLYALLHISDLQAPRAFHKWIYAIVASRIADAQRRTAHEGEVIASLSQFGQDDVMADIPDEDDEEFLPENVLIKQESREQIHQMIHHLTQAQREVIILHYFADFSTAAIAEILGIQAVAVRKRLHDARAALAAQLGVTEQAAPAVADSAPASQGAKESVLSRALAEDFHQCDIAASQTRVTAALGLVLQPMLGRAKLSPEASARVKTFAQRASKNPEVIGGVAGAKASMPLAAKAALCLAAILVVAGGGYALYARLNAGHANNGTPPSGGPAPAAASTASDPAASALPSDESTDASTTTLPSEDATSTPSPDVPVTKSTNPDTGPVDSGTAPVPDPPKPAAPAIPAPGPVIIVSNPQVTYHQGAVFTEADILADCGATAHDTQGQPVAVTVSGLKNIDTTQTGIWKVFLHATDTKGAMAKTKVITIRIVE
ncbi:MAG: sigma-70 family RNA polymerase sigma factor [Coriobacteriia bacterium]|nr:sigma-70 family RNA polymerase sigma factor [Coriobacteriia bacterium]